MLSLRKLYIEALTPNEFRPLMKIGRRVALQRINQIWSRLEQQSKQKSRSGDRLYFDIQSSGPDEVQDPLKNDINQKLDQYGYELIDFAQGTSKKKGDKNIARLGKILTMIGKRDATAIDLLNKYNNSKSTKVTGNQYIMVISKHPYDIGGMSTDRGWTSCMDLRSGMYQEYVPIDIKRGTLVSYLIDSMDMNIKKPVARVSIKPYINEEDKNDVLYGVEHDEVKYGRGHSGYIKTLVSILDKAQQEKTGVFKFDEKIYQDSERTDINRANQVEVRNFELKVKPMIKELSNGTYNELYNVAPWLQNAEFEDAELDVLNGRRLIWRDGTWKNGTWKNGVWKTGKWQNGTWNGGTWNGGTWYDGTWNGGTWNGGTWYDGTWNGGTWLGGTWETGIWKDGSWEDGNWKNGTWERGVWVNGAWLDGLWKIGTWKDGTWKDGIWKNGFWLGGTWKGGDWLGGSWQSKTQERPE